MMNVKVECFNNDRKLCKLMYDAICSYVKEHSKNIEKGQIAFNYICDLKSLGLENLPDGQKLFQIILNGDKTLCMLEFRKGWKDPIRGWNSCVVVFISEYFYFLKALMKFILNKSI